MFTTQPSRPVHRRVARIRDKGTVESTGSGAGTTLLATGDAPAISVVCVMQVVPAPSKVRRYLYEGTAGRRQGPPDSPWSQAISAGGKRWSEAQTVRDADLIGSAPV